MKQQASLVFFFLVATICMAQKAKVKKDILYEDKSPVAQFEKDGKNVILKNMAGEELLQFHYHVAQPYEEGPVLPVYWVVNSSATDSFVISHIYHHNQSRKGDLIVENWLLKDGQVDPEKFERCKSVFDQKMVDDFLDKYEVSLEELVRRFPNQPYFLKNIRGGELQINTKYFIATGDMINHTVVGYAMLRDHHANKIDYHKMSFFLPNGIEVAHIVYDIGNPRNIHKLYTIRDRTYQDYAGEVMKNPAGVLKAVEFLVGNKYL